MNPVASITVVAVTAGLSIAALGTVAATQGLLPLDWPELEWSASDHEDCERYAAPSDDDAFIRYEDYDDDCDDDEHDHDEHDGRRAHYVTHREDEGKADRSRGRREEDDDD